MKRIYLIIIYAFFVADISAWALEYRPFVEENKIWVIEEYKDGQGLVYYAYIMKGDTVIDGKQYKPLFHYDTESGNTGKYITAMREEYGRVYAFHPYEKGSEIPVFDITLNVGDSLVIPTLMDSVLRVTYEDTMYNQGFCYRRICLNNTLVNYSRFVFAECGWVERVGDALGPLGFYVRDSRTFSNMQNSCLAECRVDGKLIYKYSLAEAEKERENFASGLNNYPSMADGQCSMLHDLQGRRLTQEPQQGVFIKNGRKVVKGK